MCGGKDTPAGEGPAQSPQSSRSPQPPRPRAGFWGCAAVLAVYALLAVVYLRPSGQTFADHITPDPEDPVFNLYVLKWGIHQVETGFPGFWDANFYHPTRGTLALSDHLLGPALLGALLVRLLPGAVAAYNALLLATFPLTGLAVFWVLRKSGCSALGSFLGGAMVAFSPFRWSQLNHLQILWMQWIPWALWFWDRLLAERRPKNAAFFLLFYLLNLCGGCYLAYMIHFPMLVILASRLAREGRSLFSKASLRILVPTGAVALTAAALLFAPYVRLGGELETARSVEEIGEFGAASISFVTPSPRNLYFGRERVHQLEANLGEERAALFLRPEGALFAGFLPTALAVAGIALFLGRYRGRPSVPLSLPRRAVLGVLGVAAALAYAAGDLLTLGLARDTPLGSGLERLGWAPLGLILGTALAAWWWLRRRWGNGAPLAVGDMDPWERSVAGFGALCFLLAHPAVYVPLMHVVPGLDGMRVAARFYVFTSLALAFFAVRGLDAWMGSVRRGPRLALGAALSLLLAVELAPIPPRWIPLLTEEHFPPVYAWLRDRPEVTALVELPIRRSSRETAYMYYSTLHWKPIANGFSGYHPPSFWELTEIVRGLPDAAGLALLRRMGISHAVVHAAELSPTPRRRRRGAGLPETAVSVPLWEERFLGREVELAAVFGADRVYRILPEPPASASSSRPNRSGR